MSCIRDSLTIFWTLTSFGNCISWAPSFVTHVICLTDSGWLHSRATALQWLYHRPRISARINNLSWVVFMDPNPATWCQSSPSLWSLQSWVFTVVGAVLSPTASQSAHLSCSSWPLYILLLSYSQNQYLLGDSQVQRPAWHANLTHSEP